VRVDDESGEGVVEVILWFVADDGQDVETGENRVGEVDIVIEVLIWLVNTPNWVSGRDNGASCLEGGNNACLGD
jgi:hypothetical protein